MENAPGSPDEIINYHMMHWGHLNKYGRGDAEVFKRMYDYLQSVRYTQGRSPRTFFLSGIRICRSGAQWEMLPAHHGKVNSVYKRFSRWAEPGVWYRMFRYFAQDADMENVMLDFTIVRAHA